MKSYSFLYHVLLYENGQYLLDKPSSLSKKQWRICFIASYYIKCVTTSWTYSRVYLDRRSKRGEELLCLSTKRHIAGYVDQLPFLLAVPVTRQLQPESNHPSMLAKAKIPNQFRLNMLAYYMSKKKLSISYSNLLYKIQQILFWTCSIIN